MLATSRVRILCASLALLCVTLAAIPASAQYRASLQGTVTDPQGAVVPGATVTLTDKETNRTLETVTNETGAYVFNALAARAYTLSVELAGFKKNVLDNVQIIAEQSNALNVQLELGQTNETVTVNSAAALIDTATGNISGTITAAASSDAAIVRTRSPSAPAARARRVRRRRARGRWRHPESACHDDWRRGSSSGIFATENGGQIVANGARTGENNYQIDGVGVTSVSWGGTTVITPNEDSIKEIKVVTNNYDAENGRYRGAQVQMISQNGTNQLHGSAFFKWDRPGLNAFQKYNGYGKAVQKNTAELNDFGGTAGGPILKDKLFGFFSYESIRASESADTVQGWYQTPQYMAHRSSCRQCRRTVPDVPRIVSDRGHGAHGRGRRPWVRGYRPHRRHQLPLHRRDRASTSAGRSRSRWARATRRSPDSSLPALAATARQSGESRRRARPALARNRQSHQEHGIAVQRAGRFQCHGQGPARLQHVSRPDRAAIRSTARTRADERVPSARQLNEAETILWNRVFSGPLAERGTGERRGLALEGFGQQPGRPVGAAIHLHPERGRKQHDWHHSSRTITSTSGSARPASSTSGRSASRTRSRKCYKSHTLKMGGEVTRMRFVDTAPWSARPSYYFNNMWDFLNDAPIGGERARSIR